MRRIHLRSVVSIAISALAIASPLVIALPWPFLASPPAPPPILQAGDAALVNVTAYDPANGSVVWASPAPLHLFLGNGTFQGVLAHFANKSVGAKVKNVTLPAYLAGGNRTDANLVNISRVEDLQRLQAVSLYALENYLGHAVQVGDRIPLPTWNATVVEIQYNEALIRGDPKVGEVVHYYLYWPSTVLALTNQSIQVRNDPTPNGSFVIHEPDGSNVTARTTDVNATQFVVDLNPPYAGRVLRWSAVLLSIDKNPMNNQEFTGHATGQGQCEQCHASAGFSSFTAKVTTEPTASGTYVNVTVVNPWLHTDNSVALSVEAPPGAISDSGPALSQTINSIASQQSQTASFFLHPVAKKAVVNLTVNLTAHFQHGAPGPPDDLPYALTIPVNLLTRSSVGSAALSGLSSPVYDLWGRGLGWVAVPLLALPGYQGYRVWFRRAARKPLRTQPWSTWINLHILPSFLAVIVGFGHAAVLMWTNFRGDGGWGIWTGYISLIALGFLGITGIILARWFPIQWQNGRKWHHYLTLVAFGFAILHMILIGTSFAGLRAFLPGF
ncbi:MAG: hypothetical protein ACYDDF_02955 [Thermoplasmatota archaeon]